MDRTYAFRARTVRTPSSTARERSKRLSALGQRKDGMEISITGQGPGSVVRNFEKLSNAAIAAITAAVVSAIFAPLSM
jgi:hypothetical protein